MFVTFFSYCFSSLTKKNIVTPFQLSKMPEFLREEDEEVEVQGPRQTIPGHRGFMVNSSFV